MRPCLDCGTPTSQTRCPAHTRQRDAQRWQRKRELYTTEWRNISRAAIAAHPWCSQCGTTDDLTTDHVVAGTLDGGVAVLCRPCNSAKRDR